MELNEKQFEPMRVAAYVALPAGAHLVKDDTAATVSTNTLFRTIVVEVLTEKAGPVVKDTKTITVKLCPRWLPRWLWRRFPTAEYVASLTVQPVYSYPHSTMQIPKLGVPVRTILPPVFSDPLPYWDEDDDDEYDEY